MQPHLVNLQSVVFLFQTTSSTQPTPFKQSETLQILTYTLRKSLQTASTLSATSKQCFEQPAASFLVYSLIFIEY